MNLAEIIVVVVIGLALLAYLVLYLFHLFRIKKRTAGDKKPKKEEKASVEDMSNEQKPVPVGIIKESTLTKKDNEEYDLAPLKEHSKPDKKEEIKKEVKSLSPEMKKVIMSDILKPKF